MNAKESYLAVLFTAVKSNGTTIPYDGLKEKLEARRVKKQTPEMCTESVKQNGWLLEYIKKQTEIMCIEAVKQNGQAIRYVNKKTYNICLEAIKQNRKAIKYIKKKKFPEIHEIWKILYG